MAGLANGYPGIEYGHITTHQSQLVGVSVLLFNHVLILLCIYH